MVKIDEKLQALADDAVGLLAFDVGDKAHAAGIMLVPGVIKTLLLRQAHRLKFPLIQPNPNPDCRCGQAKIRGSSAFCTHTPQVPVAAQHGGIASNAALDSIGG
jgi:hypothetical protein